MLNRTNTKLLIEVDMKQNQHKDFLDKFNQLYPGRKVLLLVEAGSHFFNLNGPNSDHDYRGIYLPSPEEFINDKLVSMNEFKTQEGNKLNVKNTSQDIDFTMFSLFKFLDLLGRGDFNCMELLHAPEDKIIIDSPEMRELRGIRRSLMVNDISAFLGFIKKEYKRYGVNIHHFDQQQNFMEFLKTHHEHTLLKDIKPEIEEFAKGNDYISFTESRTGKNNSVWSVKIAQRLYQGTNRVNTVVQAIEQRLATYGHRQRSMAAAGVEFKGLYHAQRLIFEANDLYDYGEMKIPFDSARHSWLMEIKSGTVDQDKLFNELDRQIDELYKREKEVVSNKKQVQNLIDKIMFSIEGKNKVNALIKTVV